MSPFCLPSPLFPGNSQRFRILPASDDWSHNPVLYQLSYTHRKNYADLDVWLLPLGGVPPVSLSPFVSPFPLSVF